MTVAHLKIATIAFSAMAAAAVALDPTVKVAIIMSVPATITGLGTLALGFLNRLDQKKSLVNQAEMKDSMDGHFGKLLAEKAAQGAELVDKTDKLAHAEGRREGIESTEHTKSEF
jgi:hypothetical protein